MKNKFKRLLIGVLVGFLFVASLTTAFAASKVIQKSLHYNNIKITLDGKEVIPTDASGNYVEPFIIDGTTYLPVRGIASALELDVNWDENTNTVKLSTQKNQNQKSDKVIYNANGIEVTYLGYDINFDVNDYNTCLTINLLINNTSSQKVELYCDDDYTSINGFMTNGLMAQPVAAGKKANAKFTFRKHELDKHDIKSIEEMEIGFYYQFNNKYIYSGALPLIASNNENHDIPEHTDKTKNNQNTNTVETLTDYICENGYKASGNVYFIEYEDTNSITYIYFDKDTNLLNFAQQYNTAISSSVVGITNYNVGDSKAQVVYETQLSSGTLAGSGYIYPSSCTMSKNTIHSFKTSSSILTASSAETALKLMFFKLDDLLKETGLDVSLKTLGFTNYN